MGNWGIIVAKKRRCPGSRARGLGSKTLDAEGNAPLSAANTATPGHPSNQGTLVWTQYACLRHKLTLRPRWHAGWLADLIRRDRREHSMRSAQKVPPTSPGTGLLQRSKRERIRRPLFARGCEANQSICRQRLGTFCVESQDASLCLVRDRGRGRGGARRPRGFSAKMVSVFEGWAELSHVNGGRKLGRCRNKAKEPRAVGDCEVCA
ncbi:hypothetical protein GQ53DRAFT_396770 [Thozetella sp. PMI_491]|nr:hypothetical protein GQ53DRAFT_396770 [Thozetella sp. PMI_491]